MSKSQRIDRLTVARRRAMSRAAVGTMAVSCTASGSTHGAATISQLSRDSVPASFKVSHRRIRQSLMGWCFNPMPVPELIGHCVDIGIEAIEGIDSRFYPEATARGSNLGNTH